MMKHTILFLTEQHINNFMPFYRASFPEATMLPEMQILEDHVIPWFQRWHLGFGIMGEQGAESIHTHIMKIERSYQGIANTLKSTCWSLPHPLFHHDPHSRSDLRAAFTWSMLLHPTLSLSTPPPLSRSLSSQWRRQDWRKRGGWKRVIGARAKFLMPRPLISAARVYFGAIATPTRPRAQKLK